MNSKVNATKNTADVLKWLGVLIFLIAGVVANYHYQEIAWSLRLAGWILLSLIMLAVASRTSQGQRFQKFAKDSQIELRKVVWPTRQETIRFTIGVIVMVVIMAIALWLIDTTLLWIVKVFTGQRG